MRVWIVTSTELGWDCIINVFNADDISREELEERYPRRRAYVVHYGPHRVLSEIETDE
jgi:hypothetical protein